MKRVVGLWVYLLSAGVPLFAQVDTSYIYNTSTPYGTLDLRIAKSPTRYYYLQEDVTFSFRESAPGVKTNTYRDMTNWDSSPYRQGNLRERNGSQDYFIMNYRFLMPKNYDPDYDPGYPIIVMLHGYGERGNCWFNNCYWSTPSWNPNSNSPPAPKDANSSLLNNDHNLLHGGLKHLNAVNLAGGKKPDDPTLDPKAFPGFVLFPQSLNGWQQSARVEEAIKLLRLLIKKYNIDENRVYIHALSNGGGGLYQAIKRAPWLFAAALPMSAVTNSGATHPEVIDQVASIPLWVFQGGKDQNPTPGNTYNTIKALREAGAVVRYSLYSHLGHGTWNTAYNEPDFFSWMLSKRKTNPHITYGNPVICNTNGTGVTISFAEGFFAYQWEKDGEILAGQTGHRIVVNTPGTVRGRFSRKPNPGPADWEPWCDPIEVTEINPAKPTPELLTSMHLRGPGLPSTAANNTISLRSNEKADLYRWYRNGNPLNLAHTDIDDTLRVASVTSSNTTGNGNYTLQTVYSYCPSPESDPVKVFFDNSAPQNMTFDAAKANVEGIVIDNGIYLTWKDVVSNESGYEVWRRKSGTQHFVFAGRTPPNAISFFDSPLEPGATYEYKLRAVSDTGVSNYIPGNDLGNNYTFTTGNDHIPPSPPQDLRMTSNTINSFTISWQPASDNTPIKEYVIQYGESTKNTGGPVTTYTVTGLPASKEFPVTVRARDHAGNVSYPSNQIMASTYVMGLNYKHSTGAWQDLDEPSIKATWNDPEFTGTVSNITLAPRTQEDFFNFQFTGFLDIPVAGVYQFRLSSDDGSRLILDAQVLIDNDGTHGPVAKDSNPKSLSAGPHAIEIQYFDYSGGHSLSLTYKGPNDGSFKNIPDAWFRSAAYTPGPKPPTPTGLTVSGAGANRINVGWSSPAGTNVEVYRALSSNATYEIIGRSTSGSFGDTVNLLPSTTYYYKVRAVNSTGVSGFTGVASASTGQDNTPPSIPTGLTVNAESHTHLVITWDPSTDNVKVDRYEIYLDDALVGTSSIPAFMVSDLAPGTQYTVTIRAVDSGDNKSDPSAPLGVSTTPTATYYSLPSGSLASLSSWNSRQDGSGQSPADFSTSGQSFIIANRTEASLQEPWTVTGEASWVILSPGITLNVNAAFQGKLEVRDNAIVNLNHEVVPQFTNVTTTATVNFAATEHVPAGRYGIVMLSGSGSKTFEEGVTEIIGDLRISNGLLIKGVAGNKSTVKVHGNVNINGALAPTAGESRVHLILSEGSHTLSAGGQIHLYQLSLEEGCSLTVNATGGNVRLHTGSGNGGGILVSDDATFDLGSNSVFIEGAGFINRENEAGVIAATGASIFFTSASNDQSNLRFHPENNRLDSLVVDISASGSLVVRSPLRITRGIRVEDGVLQSDGFITLVSTSAGTAYVAPLGSSAKILGAVTVQKYFHPVDGGWYDLSTPVQGLTVADWQAYFPISGEFEGASTPGEPTMYVSSSNGLTPWPEPDDSNEAPVNRGVGYHTQVTTSGPVTLEVSGNLFTGNVQLPLSPPGVQNAGWSLVGNPYASPIKWNEGQGWQRSGVGNVIAVWTTQQIGGQLVGRFVYHDLTFSRPIIQSGQGFWVQTFGSAPSLRVEETAKKTGTSQSPGLPWLRIALKRGGYVDEAFVVFNPSATEGSNVVYEARKMSNQGVYNLSTLTDNGLQMAVNHLPDKFCSLNVPLHIDQVTPGSYSLEFTNLQSMSTVGALTLTDQFTNTVQAVSGSYSFTITDDSASWASDRFLLRFDRFEVDVESPHVVTTHICEGEPPIVEITGVQPGAVYRVLDEDGDPVSDYVKATENAVHIELDNGAITEGVNRFTVEAGFEGCSFHVLNDEAVLTFIPSFEIVVDKEEVTICQGTSAMLKASGTPSGGAYRWFDSEGNELSSGTSATYNTSPVMFETVFYVAGVHPGGCESQRKAIYIFPDTLEVPIVYQTGDTLYTQTDANYRWRRNGTDITGAVQPFYIPDRSGDYTVVAWRGDCERESATYYFVIDPDCPIDTSTPTPMAANLCGEGVLEITVTDTEADVEYFAINVNEDPLSHVVKSPGGTIVLTVPGTALDSGANQIFIRADYEKCILRVLDSSLVVMNITVPEPEITYEGFVLRTDSIGTLQWKRNGEVIEGATGASFYPYASGAYSVVLDIEGCQRESLPYDVIVTSTEPASDKFSLSVFPVPARRDEVMLRITSMVAEPVWIRIIDIQGREVFSCRFELAPEGDVPLRPRPGFSEGMYFLIGNQGEREVRRRFVIKD